MSRLLPIIGDGGEQFIATAQYRRAMQRCHLLILACATVYLLMAYPAAGGPIAALGLCAVAAECLPWRWRRWFVPELCLLSSGLATYIWTVFIDHNLGGQLSVVSPEWAFAGWIRMVLLFWALVPSRIRMAKVAAAMLAGELLMVTALASPGLPAMLSLLAIIILALGCDTWLSNMRRNSSAVSVGTTREIWPWTGLISAALVLSLIGGLLGWLGRGYMSEVGSGELAVENIAQQHSNSLNLSTSIGLGDDAFSDQDPSLTARLLFSDDMPRPGTMLYIRALTTPELYLDGDRVRWRSAATPSVRFTEIPQLHNGHETRMAILFRQRGSNDLVLRPDHSALVDLPGMFTDLDGNLYRSGLGEFPRRYPVDLGRDNAPRPFFEDDDRNRHRALPTAIATLIADEVPEVERWRRLGPDGAAAAIADWLRRRATYSMRDLPEPLPGVAGDLRAFLFGSPRQRQGHCQYFTTASVILLRASGYAARPVLGFASDEQDQQGITFRALHAHAWSEYLDNQGHWQRLDTTPPAGLAERSAGIPLDDTLDVDAEEAIDLEPAASRAWWWALSAAVVFALAVLVIGQRWLELRGIDPATRRLRKQHDALIRCALDCGVAVNPATTLTDIAQALEQRSGVDLRSHLQAHLAARFGHGPLPEPWPVAQIRQGYRERRHRNLEGS